MSKEYIRKQAARKAVTTLRVNLLAKVNIDEVKQLCIEIREKEYSIDDDITRIGIIAKEIGPTTWKSFCRFGDRKSATPGLILYWINNNTGMSLDEQAMWITENYGMEVLPDELATFMMDHDRGKSLHAPYAELNELYKLFKEMTGFNYDYTFIKAQLFHEKSSMEPMPF